MIIGDEKLDRRDPPGCANKRRERSVPPGFTTKAGIQGREEKFYLDSL
jgi:hypothetical protein